MTKFITVKSHPTIKQREFIKNYYVQLHGADTINREFETREELNSYIKSLHLIKITFIGHNILTDIESEHHAIIDIKRNDDEIKLYRTFEELPNGAMQYIDCFC